MKQMIVTKKDRLEMKIRVCKHCGKVDIDRFLKYEVSEDGDIELVGAYEYCRDCGGKTDYTKKRVEELKKERGKIKWIDK